MIKGMNIKFSITTLLFAFSMSTMHAKEIRTEIQINATPQKVWDILTTFENYPNWNPFITKLEGNVKAGNKIVVEISPPDAKKRTFKPKVLVFEPQKELRWIGRLILPGIFDGEHVLELIDNDNGTTTFVQREKLPVGVIWR